MKRYIRSSSMTVYDDENGGDIILTRTNTVYTLSKSRPFRIYSMGSHGMSEDFEDYQTFCKELKYLLGNGDAYEKLSRFKFYNKNISEDGSYAVLVSKYQNYSTYCYLDRLLDVASNSESPMHHTLLDKDYSFIRFPLSYTLHKHQLEV